MKRPTRILLAIAFLTLGQALTLADEPRYLEFARALRGKRRAPDLALEYLQELSKKPNLPKDLISFLPLEMAECRMELAQLETDSDARNRILAQAEKEFREFLASHANSPQAAGANLQLARIVSQQGMSQLTFALRQDSKEARVAEKEKARAKFDQAAGSLTAAAGQIEALLKKPELTAAERRALSRDKRLAQFELGANLFHKANTFTDEAARAVTIGQARDVLKKLVASGGDKDSLYYEYLAWLGRCYAETDDPKNAEPLFADVFRQKGPESEPGKRLAGYFRLQFMERDPNIKPEERPKKIETEAANWLTAYKEYDNSPEGYAVRFLLAKSYFSQAQRLANQKSAEAKDMYAKAERLFDAIEHADNDFSQEAHDFRTQAIFQRSSEISGGDIAKLEKFQECYLRAQYEIYKMGEEAEQAGKSPAKPKEFEAQRQKRLHNTIEALSRALDLVDDQTTQKDQTEAQYLLTFAYLASDLPYEAAVLGEDLARREPKSTRAVAAAGYALEAYSRILAEQEHKGSPKAALESDQNRVRSLASFMEATWPKNPATNLARYQLGLIAIKTNNYADAIAVLSRVTPDYPAYPATQFDLAVFAALPAMKDKANPPPGQPPTYYQDQAIAALRRIPDPPAAPDAAATRYYLLGKQQLAMLLLGARQYDEMVQVSQKLQKQFKELTIEDNLRKGMEPVMETLGLLTQYAQAEIAYRAGQYDKVRAVIDPMLKDVTNQVRSIKDLEAKSQKEQDDFDAQLQQKLKDNQPIKDEDQKKLEEYKEKVSRLGQQGHWKAQLLRSLLILALRSKVQEGNTQQAQEVFDVLKNTSEYFEGGATGVLLEIVQQLKTQIGELEAAAATDPAKKEELNKILAGFTTFLDKLAEQPTTLSEDLIGFVTNSYSGMKKHKKAAEMLAKIPQPSPAPANPNEKPEDKEKREQEDRRKEAFYHHVRLMYVRELRLDKQFDKASTEIRKIVAAWGRNNLDAQKEQIYILEDEGKYAQAANMWGRLMQDKLKPHVGKDNRLTEQYFECYYHRVWCIDKFAMKQTDADKKQKYLAQAASQIVQLDRTKVVLPDHLKKKFDELLKQEAPLRKQYDELRKGEKAALHQ